MREKLTNLLAETEERLVGSGKTPRDVIWVGVRDRSCSWDEFATLASTFSYNRAWGDQEVNPELVIVGNGWWLARSEYDGSEWWSYFEPPTKPPAGTFTLDQIDGGA